MKLISGLIMTKLILKIIPVLKWIFSLLYQYISWNNSSSSLNTQISSISIPINIQSNPDHLHLMPSKSMETNLATVSTMNNNNTGFRKRCSLCMEGLQAPTCAPCGHVYCWSCIGSWMTTSSNASTVNGQSSGRCPVCRRPLRPEALRPLFGYS